MSDDLCPICYETIKLNYTLPCGHKFCYLCLKHAILSNCHSCPYCRSKLPDNIVENATTSDQSVTGSHWMYAGRTNGWWYYDTDTDDKLEQAYIKYQKEPEYQKITVEILGNDYKIDFLKMRQKCRGKRRPIKRVDDVDSVVKGMAGLKVQAIK